MLLQQSKQLVAWGPSQWCYRFGFSALLLTYLKQFVLYHWKVSDPACWFCTLMSSPTGDYIRCNVKCKQTCATMATDALIDFTTRMYRVIGSTSFLPKIGTIWTRFATQHSLNPSNYLIDLCGCNPSRPKSSHVSCHCFSFALQAFLTLHRASWCELRQW